MDRKIETGSNLHEKQTDTKTIPGQESDSNAGKTRKKKASKDITEDSGSVAENRSNKSSENSGNASSDGSNEGMQ